MQCAFCYMKLDARAAKRCGQCNKRIYCSRECQTADWSKGQHHKVWCCLNCGEQNTDWEIRKSETSGLGVFALRDFEPGERIMVERVIQKSSQSSADAKLVETLMGFDTQKKWMTNALGKCINTTIIKVL